jgi:DNA invertase Pin-like site-specific DNA recombinase
MTYKFNKEQHTTKIKAGLETAKKKGKKLGRPKGGKIKGEDRVLGLYNQDKKHYIFGNLTISKIAELSGISKSTVQKIINKYRNEN